MGGRRTRRGGGLVVAVAVLVGASVSMAGAATPVVAWAHQLGTPNQDSGTGVAVDAAGDSVIVGSTPGTLPGSVESNAGDFDAFVAKYDTKGQREWLHELGSSSFDTGDAVAVDGNGDVFVAGSTTGTLPGSADTNAGGEDAFLAKYDASGTRQWVREIGTPQSDGASSVAVDGSGFVHIVGFATGKLPGASSWGGKSDIFEATYAVADGSRAWVTELGAAADEGANGVTAARNGSTFVAGSTFDQLPGAPEPYGGGADTGDAFVAKLNAAGKVIWVHQLGTAADELGASVALAPKGGVYLAGDASGALPGAPESYLGNGAGFLARYDKTGARVWIHEVGTTHGAQITSVVAAGSRVDIAGQTSGHIASAPQQPIGGVDSFVARFDPTGTLLDAQQFGTTGDDDAQSIALAAHGALRVTGLTMGTLPGSPETNQGEADAFLLNYLHV